MIVSFALSVAVFYVFGRYRFPLVPLLALFAGKALAEMPAWYRKRGWRAQFAVFFVLLISAAFVNWPIYAFSGPDAAGYNNLSNAYYKQGRGRLSDPHCAPGARAAAGLGRCRLQPRQSLCGAGPIRPWQKNISKRRSGSTPTTRSAH